MLTTGVRLSHARVEGEGLRRNPTRRPINEVTGGCGAVPLDRNLRDGRDGRPLFSSPRGEQWFLTSFSVLRARD